MRMNKADFVKCVYESGIMGEGCKAEFISEVE